MVAINKADGDNVKPAKQAKVEYDRALRLMPRKSEHWEVPVVTCSGLMGDGLDELWAEVSRYREVMIAAGEWETNRAEQRVQAMWRAIEWAVMGVFRGDPGVQERVAKLEAAVREGKVAADHAAAELLAVFRSGSRVC